MGVRISIAVHAVVRRPAALARPGARVQCVGGRWQQLLLMLLKLLMLKTRDGRGELRDQVEQLSRQNILPPGDGKQQRAAAVLLLQRIQRQYLSPRVTGEGFVHQISV